MQEIKELEIDVAIEEKYMDVKKKRGLAIGNWNISFRREKKNGSDSVGTETSSISAEDYAAIREDIAAGHRYPNIVKGLKISGFGVYNCDQIYRVSKPASITAKYIDKDGVEINSGILLSMIDLNYNGAFSFHPKRFQCNLEGNNVLLLFTAESQMYLLEKGEFEKMQIKSSGEYTFVLKNVTDLITNSKDLAGYLKGN